MADIKKDQVKDDIEEIKKDGKTAAESVGEAVADNKWKKCIPGLSIQKREEIGNNIASRTAELEMEYGEPSLHSKKFIRKTIENSYEKTERNADSTPQKSTNTSVNNTKPEHIEKKKVKKSYENRKNCLNISNKETSPETSNSNTSRYGRARKPKITEDYYNIEDIFCPYEKITSVSPKRKPHRLELSPNTLNNSTTDLTTTLNINIPDDNTEVSKVMKLVSNNLEFSPKSPTYGSKHIKTYGNKKKILESHEYKCINGKKYERKEIRGEKSDIYKSLRLFSDDSFNSDSSFNESPIKSYSAKRTNSKLSLNRQDSNGSLKKQDSNESSKEEINKEDNRECLNEELKKQDSDETSIKGSKKEASYPSPNKEKVKDLSSEYFTNLVKENKKINKLQRELNITEFKSGRLRSSIPDKLDTSIEQNKEQLITEIKEEIIEDETQVNKTDIKSIGHTLVKNEDSHQGLQSYTPIIGGLAWSRVGTYPFWPSIVTNEPASGKYTRMMMLGRKNVRFYHVHFFGDNGRRSWVLATHIFPFFRRSDLEIMAQSVSKDCKTKDPKHLSAFIINPNKLKKWETAVTESENLTDFSPEVRIQKFFEMVTPRKRKKSLPSLRKKNKREMRYKKIKLDKKVLKKFKKKKKISKRLALKLKECIKTSKNVKTEENMLKTCSLGSKDESLDENISKTKTKNIKNKLESGKIMKKSLKKRKAFKISSDDSSSDSESKDDISETAKQDFRDTPSPEPQLTSLQRHKRINLFRGITKDRVCQICGKNKKVYKCKGNCFGNYHIECDRKIRIQILKRLNDEKSSNSSEDEDENKLEENREEKPIKIDPTSKINDHTVKNTDSTTKIENNKESSNLNKEIDSEIGKTVDEGQKIQTSDDKPKEVSVIIEEILDNVHKTVDNSNVDLKKESKSKIKESNIKTTRNLSIAEQIDLKMAEVMKNLMQDTKYTDDTSDEESINDENESITIDPFDKSQSTEEEQQILEEFSHLPYFDSVEDDSKSEKDKTKVKKVIKHVTADGIFDIIEEDELNNEDFKCTYCSTGVKPPCFICNKEISKSGDEKKHKCITPQCGKYFHSECLKDWPQTKWNASAKTKKIDRETLTCPYHNCHTCISDNPRGPISRFANEKLAKCIRCPTTYHSTNFCIPAGTEILSLYQLICPKHLQTSEEEDSSSVSSSPSSRKSIESRKSDAKKSAKLKIMPHVNASWCFICSMGGSLICCETCPSAFHVECLKLVPPEGRYLCEECESGRLPLYDEIVWVKLGYYRWWPAKILFPAEIPANVANIPHTIGEFVVRFFGSHDHYWVNRGRVFLFQEGDTGHASSKKSVVDGLFIKAIKEATRAHKKFIDGRANRAAEAQNGMKPPHYIKMKVNRPIGNVRTNDADTSNTNPCDCDPNWDEPCGPDSDCLNRILMTECNPMVCAAGSRCCNQSFEKRLYLPVAPFKTTGRGWGLKTLAPIKKGSFVIEYVGEVINEVEYQRRLKRKHEQKDENYYFLTIDKDRMIDAGPKGNVARFMNHSCSPNCETQKWTVNGDTRVGLFAITNIPTGAELTFNYNLECIGEEKKECRCGAPNCSGFIGVKAKQDEATKKRKSGKYKKKKSLGGSEVMKLVEVITCFVCGEPDAIQPCDREACSKFYHLNCVNLENFEVKWLCPWHSCNMCTKRTTRCCYMCINSFCPLHSEGNIRYDRVKGFVCTTHDVKEEDKEESDAIEETKSKESLKTKKIKKQLGVSNSEVRSSTDSKTEEMSENQDDAITQTEKNAQNIENLQNNEENKPALNTKLSSIMSLEIKEGINKSSDVTNNEEERKIEVETAISEKMGNDGKTEKEEKLDKKSDEDNKTEMEEKQDQKQNKDTVMEEKFDEKRDEKTEIEEKQNKDMGMKEKLSKKRGTDSKIEMEGELNKKLSDRKELEDKRNEDMKIEELGKNAKTEIEEKQNKGIKTEEKLDKKSSKADRIEMEEKQNKDMKMKEKLDKKPGKAVKTEIGEKQDRKRSKYIKVDNKLDKKRGKDNKNKIEKIQNKKRNVDMRMEEKLEEKRGKAGKIKIEKLGKKRSRDDKIEMDEKQDEKRIKDDKSAISLRNGALMNLSNLEETGSSSDEVLQIDILLSSNNKPNSVISSIKKRKSRLSLKKSYESSNYTSNTSQEELSDDEKPLIKRMKMDLEENVSSSRKISKKLYENKEKQKKKLSHSTSKMIDSKKSKRRMSTDLESSSTSDADFKITPRVSRKTKNTKKFKMANNDTSNSGIKILRSAAVNVSIQNKEDIDKLEENKVEKQTGGIIEKTKSRSNIKVESDKKNTPKLKDITPKNVKKISTSTPKTKITKRKSSKTDEDSSSESMKLINIKVNLSKLDQKPKSPKKVNLNSSQEDKKTRSTKIKAGGKKFNLSLFKSDSETTIPYKTKSDASDSSSIPKTYVTKVKSKVLRKPSMRRSSRHLKQSSTTSTDSENDTVSTCSSLNDGIISDSFEGLIKLELSHKDLKKENRELKKEIEELKRANKKTNYKDTKKSKKARKNKKESEDNMTIDDRKKSKIKKGKKSESIEKKKIKSRSKKSRSSDLDNVQNEEEKIKVKKAIKEGISEYKDIEKEIPGTIIIKQKSKASPVKRKRGRPRKYPRPPVEIIEPKRPKGRPTGRPTGRPKGRPRKIKPEENSELPKVVPNVEVSEVKDNPQVEEVSSAKEIPQMKEVSEKKEIPSAKEVSSAKEVLSAKEISSEKEVSPVKEVSPIKEVSQVTELYKMKLNNLEVPKYENHVTEVKLTSNVPARHLRVVLRKSEVDTKVDNKFLKMQNDIERDLPIRKRSKLRYETQL